MSKSNPPEKKQFSWDKRKRANPADYRFLDEKNKFLYKVDGQIKGQAFKLQNCTQSNLYVHDQTNQVLMDDCKECCIVLGPGSSSTFIRTSHKCMMVIFCQQLRMRDCSDMEIMLYSQTEVSQFQTDRFLARRRKMLKHYFPHPNLHIPNAFSAPQSCQPESMEQ